MWDYPGQFSNLDWQPCACDVENSQLTLSIYENEQSKHFIHCYKAFKKADSIQKLRYNLEKRGFLLRTKIFTIK